MERRPEGNDCTKTSIHVILLRLAWQLKTCCRRALLCRSAEGRRPGVWLIFACLLAPRLLSAASNIVHDCDEVFNYWEPLHFLLYGHGMQTWEYRCPQPSACLNYPGLFCTVTTCMHPG
jgi:hypothetical protein